ncbi:DUF3231 family protein, partial [Ammoniphilus sp. 3BR4]|uniref:DUF3231 family protein n=1 Tax=Ammoniphilus sp. 3BR4 TaxID=3158265 RepID=UPI0034654DCD
MKTEHNIRLTSSEMGFLWTQYISDSMAVCVFKHFLEKVEDTQIQPVIEFALSLSENHVKRITQIFIDEDIPIPKGFSDEDVNVSAPRLYSDTFVLNYIRQMSRVGMATSSLALSHAARSDFTDFYTQCLSSTAELNNRSGSVLLSKGLFIRPPFIPKPEKVDFVEKQNFLTGWFGERRPLNAIEITHIFINSQTNALGKGLIIGFSQVAQSKQVREFFVRGREIATKHIEIFRSILTEDNIPSPTTWDSDITTSTIPPFSDKLMMFHINGIIASGIGNYGVAMAASMRRDLSTHYSRLTVEVGQYAEDGVNIMIDNGW